MSIYILNLTLIIVLGVALCEIKPSKSKTIIYLSICLLSFSLIYTLRYALGYDYYSYKKIFQSVISSNNILQDILNSSYPTFLLLNAGVSLFTENYIALNAVFALLIFGLALYAIYRYSPMPWLSVLAYVALSLFYMSMNFVRQGMAVSIILLAYPLLRDKKFVPYMLLVLLATSIHFYAIIMIPFYFLLLIKPTSKLYCAIGALSLAGLTLSDFILRIVAQFIPNGISYLSSIYIQEGSSFRNAFMPMILFIGVLAFKKLLLEKNEGNGVLINAAFYAMIWAIFAVRHSILLRFASYFDIFMVITCAEIAICLRPQAQEAVTASAINSQKNAQQKLVQKKTLKEKWFNYRWYVISVVLVLLLNQSFIAINQHHKAFPYHTIFNEKWVKQQDYIYYEIGKGLWPAKEVRLSDLPEELR